MIDKIKLEKYLHNKTIDCPVVMLYLKRPCSDGMETVTVYLNVTKISSLEVRPKGLHRIVMDNGEMYFTSSRSDMDLLLSRQLEFVGMYVKEKLYISKN